MFKCIFFSVFALSTPAVTQILFEQGSICETRAGPNRPQTRRGMVFFVDFKYIFYENRYFWPILQLPVGFFDRNGQKAHLRTKTFHLSL